MTAAVRRWDAAAAEVPLVYATSDTAARALPVTLAYFIFDLMLIPVWEGTLVVRVEIEGTGSIRHDGSEWPVDDDWYGLMIHVPTPTDHPVHRSACLPRTRSNRSPCTFTTGCPC